MRVRETSNQILPEQFGLEKSVAIPGQGRIGDIRELAGWV